MDELWNNRIPNVIVLTVNVKPAGDSTLPIIAMIENDESMLLLQTSRQLTR